MVIDTEQEKKEIISRYRRLLRKAKPILKDGDAKLIKKAFTISLEAHKDMRRKSGEPFIFHPLLLLRFVWKKSAWVRLPSSRPSCTMSLKTPTSSWPISSGCSEKRSPGSSTALPRSEVYLNMVPRNKRRIFGRCFLRFRKMCE